MYASPENRSHLFNSDFLGDINLANDPVKLRKAIAQEVLHYAILESSDSNKCAGEPRPGLVRTQPNPGGEFPPSQVLICSINGVSIGQAQYEFEIGSSVVLEGMNFSSIDTKVQFMDSSGNTRMIDVFVCGDEETPLTENINGTETPIIDCRVHDRLSFRVPVDMLPGQCYLKVLVPNPNHVGGWADPISSDDIAVEMIPPSTARFEINTEKLHCADETHVDWPGSDEVGIKIAAFSVLLDLTAGEVQIPNNGEPIEFGNVDSGDTRAMDHLLFSQQQPISGVSIMIKGWEIDGTEEYNDVVSEFDKIVMNVVRQALIYYNQAEWECTHNPNEMEWRKQLSGVEFWQIALAVGIMLCIKILLEIIFHGEGVAWAPADPIIDDVISLSPVDLLQLTSTDVPLPSPSEYDINGIKVKVTPLEKSNNQYWERREYISEEEGSRYQIKFRYTRVA